jgi:hypothetical protein
VQVNLSSMSDSRNVIGPAVGIGLDVVRATVIAAIDQDVTDAAGAHLAEGDLLWGGRHRCGLVLNLYRPDD